MQQVQQQLGQITAQLAQITAQLAQLAPIAARLDAIDMRMLVEWVQLASSLVRRLCECLLTYYSIPRSSEANGTRLGDTMPSIATICKGCGLRDKVEPLVLCRLLSLHRQRLSMVLAVSSAVLSHWSGQAPAYEQNSRMQPRP